MLETFCRAEMNYGSGLNARPVSVDIRNGRKQTGLQWEEQGFQLMNHASAVQHWEDDAEIVSVHYPEIRALAQSLTDCDAVMLPSHIKRNPEQAAIHEDLAPISFVHSDFAVSYGDMILDLYRSDLEHIVAAREVAGLSVSDIDGFNRIVILQFWRNLGETKMDLPLAFCDATTVKADELIPIPVLDYAGGGFDFEALAIRPQADDHHAWYAFPEMTQEEVAVFRTFDSARLQTDDPFWTPHSAFRDPEVSPGQPGRSSIELRATCFFKE